MGVERCHEDERYVNLMCCIQVLDLLHNKVQEGHPIFYLERAFRAVNALEIRKDKSQGGNKRTYP